MCDILLHHSLPFLPLNSEKRGGGGGRRGRVKIPRDRLTKRLMAMCHWIGSHFHD